MAASMSASAKPPDTSLTMRAPASTAASAVDGVHGVDADDGSRLGERPHDRQHPLLLHRDRHALGARTGRLAADVEQVRALGTESEPVRDRGLGVEVATAVTERVGGHVDDPHDERGHPRPAPISVMSSARAAGSVNSPRAAIVTVDASAC